MLQCRCFLPWYQCPAHCKVSRCFFHSSEKSLDWKVLSLSYRKQQYLKKEGKKEKLSSTRDVSLNISNVSSLKMQQSLTPGVALPACLSLHSLQKGRDSPVPSSASVVACDDRPSALPPLCWPLHLNFICAAPESVVVFPYPLGVRKFMFVGTG